MIGADIDIYYDRTYTCICIYIYLQPEIPFQLNESKAATIQTHEGCG